MYITTDDFAAGCMKRTDPLKRRHSLPSGEACLPGRLGAATAMKEPTVLSPEWCSTREARRPEIVLL